MEPSNSSPMELALSQPHILSQCANTIPIKLELAKTCIRYYNGINDLKVRHIQGLKYNPVDIEFYIYKKKLAFKMLEEKPMEKLSQFKSMIESTKPHNWKEHLLVKVNIACEMHKVSIYKSIKTMLEMIPEIAKFKYITLELLYERGSCVDIEPTKHKDFFVPIVEIMSVLKSNSVKEFIVKSGDIYQLAFLVSKLIRNKEFLTNTYPYIQKLKLCLLANDGRYRFANGVVDNETFDFFIKKVLPEKMYYMEERKKLLQTMDPNVDGQIWDKHEHLVLMDLISKLNLDILHFEFSMSEYTYYPVATQYTKIYQKREKNLKILLKPFNDEAVTDILSKVTEFDCHLRDKCFYIISKLNENPHFLPNKSIKKIDLVLDRRASQLLTPITNFNPLKSLENVKSLKIIEKARSTDDHLIIKQLITSLPSTLKELMIYLEEANLGELSTQIAEAQPQLVRLVLQPFSIWGPYSYSTYGDKYFMPFKNLKILELSCLEKRTFKFGESLRMLVLKCHGIKEIDRMPEMEYESYFEFYNRTIAEINTNPIEYINSFSCNCTQLKEPFQSIVIKASSFGSITCINFNQITDLDLYWKEC